VNKNLKNTVYVLYAKYWKKVCIRHKFVPS
jgi:hypothetical protein